MSDWREMTPGNFVSLQRGHDLTEGERKPGHIPVMGSAGMNGYHDTAMAKGPGVVVGRSGASFGQVHSCPVDCWPHNTALYVTHFRGNDTRFTYYFLKSLDFSHYNSSSAQPSLNRNYIYPIRVRVPEPKEQRAIAAVLGALDDKIELNRRMNETLAALAQSLFKSWFVDATQAGLPEGWREVRLAECCENIFSGGTPSTQSPEFWDSYINQSVVALVADQTVSSDIFLFFGLERRYEEFRRVSDSHSSRGSLTAKLLGDLKVILPTHDLISKFDETVGPLANRITANLQESRTLAALRDALLPKLLSGELRMPGKTV